MEDDLSIHPPRIRSVHAFLCANKDLVGVDSTTVSCIREPDWALMVVFVDGLVLLALDTNPATVEDLIEEASARLRRNSGLYEIMMGSRLGGVRARIAAIERREES